MNTLSINSNLEEVFLRVVKTVLAFWMVGWFLKADFFSGYVFHEVLDYPYWMNFFPDFFKDPLVLQFFYMLPLVCLWFFFRQTLANFRLAGMIMLISSVVLLLHQDTHNDATFLTSFWVSVWYVWFVFQHRSLNQDLFLHAKSLALCVVALVFCGGFVGKLTPEYWSGQAFADIFMLQEYGWIGQWVRAHFSEAIIRQGFGLLSKFMILGEGVLATAPLWPYRFILVFGIGLMVSISLFTTWLIFSVLSCLIGLLLAIRLLLIDQRADVQK